jgi:hypothetical protein
MCCLCMGGQTVFSFCQADPISVPQLSLIRQILQLKVLAMHCNDDGILIQSLEGASCEAQCRTGCESAPPTIVGVR